MRCVTSYEPPADGGFPVDSDLHQMSDDGCPLSPDPARWADADRRDHLRERIEFAAEERMGFPAVTLPVAAGAVTISRPAGRGMTAGGPPGEVVRPSWWASVRVGGGATPALFA